MMFEKFFIFFLKRWARRKALNVRSSCRNKSRWDVDQRSRHHYHQHDHCCLKTHCDQLIQELMTKLVMADTRSENAEMDIGRLNVRIDKVEIIIIMMVMTTMIIITFPQFPIWFIIMMVMMIIIIIMMVMVMVIIIITIGYKQGPGDEACDDNNFGGLCWWWFFMKSEIVQLMPKFASKQPTSWIRLRRTWW